jgi:adenylate kinase family enzyme
MSTMRRVVVVGGSGSGKTSFARELASRLGLLHLEMDSVFHQHGWADDAPPEFLPTLDRFTADDGWVVDGNYARHGIRDVVWPRADTIVWLDVPRWTAMTRVVRRTLRRVFTREKLWGGVREPFEEVLADGEWDHATVHRLRTSAEVTRFLDSLTGVQN